MFIPQNEEQFTAMVSTLPAADKRQENANKRVSGVIFRAVIVKVSNGMDFSAAYLAVRNSFDQCWLDDFHRVFNSMEKQNVRILAVV